MTSQDPDTKGRAIMKRVGESEPQTLSFLGFCERARIEPLIHHGRVAEVWFMERRLSFVDALGVPGLMQAHRREVNNALWVHSGEAPDHFSECELPSAVALAEYPEMRQKFPLACMLVDAANGVANETTATATTSRPNAV